MKLLTIDPGTRNNMGWAVFWNENFLCAGEGKPDDIMRYIQSADVIVFEHPEIYPQRMGKGDPNKLLGMVKQIGFIQGRAMIGCMFYEYLPCQWKGQLPKDVCRMRAQCVLTDDELSRVHAQKHNAWDAIALGLVFLRRLRLS